MSLTKRQENQIAVLEQKEIDLRCLVALKDVPDAVRQHLANAAASVRAAISLLKVPA